MTRQFVSYEIALKLKELGFDEECLGYYNHTTIPNKAIANDPIVGVIKNNRIYNESSNGRSLVGLGKGFILAPLYQQAIDWLMGVLSDQHYMISVEFYSDYSGNLKENDNPVAIFNDTNDLVTKLIGFYEKRICKSFR